MARYCRGAGRTAIAVDGNQLFTLTPLWRLLTLEVDPGIVSQSSLFFLLEGSVSFLLSWLPYPKIVYSDMAQALTFCNLLKNLDSEEDISECPLQMSALPSRQPSAEYRPEKWSFVHTVFSTEKCEFSSTSCIPLGLVPNQSRGKGTARIDPSTGNLKNFGF